MRRCTNCLIEESYPGVVLDRQGNCGACANLRKGARRPASAAGSPLKKWLKSFVGRHRLEKSRRTYDAVIALSGGKDSAFAAWLFARKYGFRCLAVTVDTGYLSPSVRANVALVCRKAGIPHRYLRPPLLFNKIFKFAFSGGRLFLRVDGLACFLCSKLIRNLLYRFAHDHGIPFIVMGVFRAGDTKLFEKENAVLLDEIAPPALLMYLRKAYSRWLYFPSRRPSGKSAPLVIYPLNAVLTTEKEKMKTLGAIFGPRRLGTFAPPMTLCLVALATMYLYRKERGYNPYGEDLGFMIRHGIYNRKAWLKRLEELERALDGPSSIRKDIDGFLRSMGAWDGTAVS